MSASRDGFDDLLALLRETTGPPAESPLSPCSSSSSGSLSSALGDELTDHARVHPAPLGSKLAAVRNIPTLERLKSLKKQLKRLESNFQQQHFEQKLQHKERLVKALLTSCVMLVRFSFATVLQFSRAIETLVSEFLPCKCVKWIPIDDDKVILEHTQLPLQWETCGLAGRIVLALAPLQNSTKSTRNTVTFAAEQSPDGLFMASNASPRSSQAESDQDLDADNCVEESGSVHSCFSLWLHRFASEVYTAQTGSSLVVFEEEFVRVRAAAFVHQEIDVRLDANQTKKPLVLVAMVVLDDQHQKPHGVVEVLLEREKPWDREFMEIFGVLLSCVVETRKKLCRSEHEPVEIRICQDQDDDVDLFNDMEDGGDQPICQENQVVAVQQLLNALQEKTPSPTPLTRHLSERTVQQVIPSPEAASAHGKPSSLRKNDSIKSIISNHSTKVSSPRKNDAPSLRLGPTPFALNFKSSSSQQKLDSPAKSAAMSRKSASPQKGNASIKANSIKKPTSGFPTIVTSGKLKEADLQMLTAMKKALEPILAENRLYKTRLQTFQRSVKALENIWRHGEQIIGALDLRTIRSKSMSEYQNQLRRVLCKQINQVFQNANTVSSRSQGPAESSCAGVCLLFANDNLSTFKRSLSPYLGYGHDDGDGSTKEPAFRVPESPMLDVSVQHEILKQVLDTGQVFESLYSPGSEGNDFGSPLRDKEEENTDVRSAFSLNGNESSSNFVLCVPIASSAKPGSCMGSLLCFGPCADASPPSSVDGLQIERTVLSAFASLAACFLDGFEQQVAREMEHQRVSQELLRSHQENAMLHKHDQDNATINEFVADILSAESSSWAQLVAKTNRFFLEKFPLLLRRSTLFLWQPASTGGNEPARLTTFVGERKDSDSTLNLGRIDLCEHDWGLPGFAAQRQEAVMATRSHRAFDDHFERHLGQQNEFFYCFPILKEGASQLVGVLEFAMASADIQEVFLSSFAVLCTPICTVLYEMIRVRKQIEQATANWTNCINDLKEISAQTLSNMEQLCEVASAFAQVFTIEEVCGSLQERIASTCGCDYANVFVSESMQLIQPKAPTKQTTGSKCSDRSFVTIMKDGETFHVDSTEDPLFQQVLSTADSNGGAAFEADMSSSFLNAAGCKSLNVVNHDVCKWCVALPIILRSTAVVTDGVVGILFLSRRAPPPMKRKQEVADLHQQQCLQFGSICADLLAGKIHELAGMMQMRRQHEQLQQSHESQDQKCKLLIQQSQTIQQSSIRNSILKRLATDLHESELKNRMQSKNESLVFGAPNELTLHAHEQINKDICSRAVQICSEEYQSNSLVFEILLAPLKRESLEGDASTSQETIFYVVGKNDTCRLSCNDDTLLGKVFRNRKVMSYSGHDISPKVLEKQDAPGRLAEEHLLPVKLLKMLKTTSAYEVHVAPILCGDGGIRATETCESYGMDGVLLMIVVSSPGIVDGLGEQHANQLFLEECCGLVSQKLHWVSTMRHEITARHQQQTLVLALEHEIASQSTKHQELQRHYEQFRRFCQFWSALFPEMISQIDGCSETSILETMETSFIPKMREAVDDFLLPSKADTEASLKRPKMLSVGLVLLETDHHDRSPLELEFRQKWCQRQVHSLLPIDTDIVAKTLETLTRKKCLESGSTASFDDKDWNGSLWILLPDIGIVKEQESNQAKPCHKEALLVLMVCWPKSDCAVPSTERIQLTTCYLRSFVNLLALGTCNKRQMGANLRLVDQTKLHDNQIQTMVWQHQMLQQVHQFTKRLITHCLAFNSVLLVPPFVKQHQVTDYPIWFQPVFEFLDRQDYHQVLPPEMQLLHVDCFLVDDTHHNVWNWPKAVEHHLATSEHVCIKPKCFDLERVTHALNVHTGGDNASGLLEHSLASIVSGEPMRGATHNNKHTELLLPLWLGYQSEEQTRMLVGLLEFWVRAPDKGEEDSDKVNTTNKTRTDNWKSHLRCLAKELPLAITVCCQHLAQKCELQLLDREKEAFQTQLVVKNEERLAVRERMALTQDIWRVYDSFQRQLEEFITDKMTFITSSTVVKQRLGAKSDQSELASLMCAPWRQMDGLVQDVRAVLSQRSLRGQKERLIFDDCDGQASGQPDLDLQNDSLFVPIEEAHDLICQVETSDTGKGIDCHLECSTMPVVRTKRAAPVDQLGPASGCNHDSEPSTTQSNSTTSHLRFLVAQLFAGWDLASDNAQPSDHDVVLLRASGRDSERQHSLVVGVVTTKAGPLTKCRKHLTTTLKRMAQSLLTTLNSLDTFHKYQLALCSTTDQLANTRTFLEANQRQLDRIHGIQRAFEKLLGLTNVTEISRLVGQVMNGMVVDKGQVKCCHLYLLNDQTRQLQRVVLPGEAQARLEAELDAEAKVHTEPVEVDSDAFQEVDSTQHRLLLSFMEQGKLLRVFEENVETPHGTRKRKSLFSLVLDPTSAEAQGVVVMEVKASLLLEDWHKDLLSHLSHVVGIRLHQLEATARSTVEQQRLVAAQQDQKELIERLSSELDQQIRSVGQLHAQMLLLRKMQVNMTLFCNFLGEIQLIDTPKDILAATVNQMMALGDHVRIVQAYQVQRKKTRVQSEVEEDEDQQVPDDQGGDPLQPEVDQEDLVVVFSSSRKTSKEKHLLQQERVLKTLWRTIRMQKNNLLVLQPHEDNDDEDKDNDVDNQTNGKEEGIILNRGSGPRNQLVLILFPFACNQLQGAVCCLVRHQPNSLLLETGMQSVDESATADVATERFFQVQVQQMHLLMELTIQRLRQKAQSELWHHQQALDSEKDVNTELQMALLEQKQLEMQQRHEQMHDLLGNVALELASMACSNGVKSTQAISWHHLTGFVLQQLTCTFESLTRGSKLVDEAKSEDHRTSRKQLLAANSPTKFKVELLVLYGVHPQGQLFFFCHQDTKSCSLALGASGSTSKPLRTIRFDESIHAKPWLWKCFSSQSQVTFTCKNRNLHCAFLPVWSACGRQIVGILEIATSHSMAEYQLELIQEFLCILSMPIEKSGTRMALTKPVEVAGTHATSGVASLPHLEERSEATACHTSDSNELLQPHGNSGAVLIETNREAEHLHQTQMAQFADVLAFLNRIYAMETVQNVQQLVQREFQLVFRVKGDLFWRRVGGSSELNHKEEHEPSHARNETIIDEHPTPANQWPPLVVQAMHGLDVSSASQRGSGDSNACHVTESQTTHQRKTWAVCFATECTGSKAVNLVLALVLEFAPGTTNRFFGTKDRGVLNQLVAALKCHLTSLLDHQHERNALEQTCLVARERVSLNKTKWKRKCKSRERESIQWQEFVQFATQLTQFNEETRLLAFGSGFLKQLLGAAGHELVRCQWTGSGGAVSNDSDSSSIAIQQERTSFDGSDELSSLEMANVVQIRLVASGSSELLAVGRLVLAPNAESKTEFSRETQQKVKLSGQLLSDALFHLRKQEQMQLVQLQLAQEHAQKQTLAQHNDKLQQKCQQLAPLKDAVRTLEQEKQLVCQEATQVKVELDKLQCQMAATTSRLAEREELMKELESRLAQVTSELESSRQETERLRGLKHQQQLETAQATITQLEQVNDRLNRKLLKRTVQVKQMKQLVESCRARDDQQRTELEDLHRQLTEAKALASAEAKTAAVVAAEASKLQHLQEQQHQQQLHLVQQQQSQQQQLLMQRLCALNAANNNANNNNNNNGNGSKSRVNGRSRGMQQATKLVNQLKLDHQRQKQKQMDLAHELRQLAVLEVQEIKQKKKSFQRLGGTAAHPNQTR